MLAGLNELAYVCGNSRGKTFENLRPMYLETLGQMDAAIS
jgi:hypothetical protein